MKPNSLAITPRTKVLELIDAYPELEDVLVQYVPAFAKLKNPLLRRTVAKVATLQQAAAIGNVKLEDLILRLRKEVGQDTMDIAADSNYVTTQPDWFDAAAVKQELDARPMLAAGEHPINQVMSDLDKLSKGDIYKLITPFLPAPLIDKASSLGIDHWISKEAEDRFLIYFRKN